MQEKIARALEKENLEKETSAEQAVKSSQLLQQELQEISKKVTQHRERRDIDKSFPEIAQARKDVIKCYTDNKDRTLDCWREAAHFRLAVRNAEQVRYPQLGYLSPS